MSATLRTVFMGTPEIAVPALRVAHALTRLTLVVSQPDRPAGRGHRLHVAPIVSTAQQLGVPLWQPETLKGQAQDPRLDCDLIIVMAYGELLRQEALDRPAFGCLNLHASLLPRWRGASPLQAALRAGDAQTGVSVMRMVRALDAGPVYARRVLHLTDATTLPELHDAMATAAAAALRDVLLGWPLPQPREQDPGQVTLCRKLTAADGQLRFAATMLDLCRWVRAYTPTPGCWVPLGSERLRILALAARPGVIDLAPGVVAARSGELLIGCADGAVAVVTLQPPGKRPMDAGDFLNGHRLPERAD